MDKVKESMRDALFDESRGECIVCGQQQAREDNWAAAQILHFTGKEKRNLHRELGVEDRTLMCLKCIKAKKVASVSRYAGTFSFGGRIKYWVRVQTRYLCGRISKSKRKMLLRDFHLLRRNHPINVGWWNPHFLAALSRETIGVCAYCGRPTPLEEGTIDHIIPRGRKGKNTFDNAVYCCSSCNKDKANTPVSAYVRSFPEKKRAAYVNRISKFVEDKHMSKEKARLLLSFQDERHKTFFFRIGKRVITVSLAANIQHV